MTEEKTEEEKPIASFSCVGDERTIVVKVWRKTKEQWRLDYPFDMDLKNDLKASCARWDGEEWTAPANLRTFYTLDYLSLGPISERYYDEEIKPVAKDYRLKGHQRAMVDFLLTRRRAIWAVEMGLGKTFSALMCMKQLKPKNILVVAAPNKVLKSWEREMDKWDIRPENITLSNYTSLNKLDFQLRRGEIEAFDFIVFDEIHHVKNPTTLASKSAFNISQKAFEVYGDDSYVIGMTGTVTPRHFVDLWGICEVVMPGFIREKNPHAFRQRFGVFESTDTGYGPALRWLFDQDDKCLVCNGDYHEFTDHYFSYKGKCKEHEEYHFLNPCKANSVDKPENKVEAMEASLKPLVFALSKKSVVKLPEKELTVIECPPTDEQIAACMHYCDNAKTSMEAYQQALKISSGFVRTAEGKLIRMERNPKLETLTELIKDQKRAIVFAHHIEAMDMICEALETPLVRVDGAGIRYYNTDVLNSKDAEEWFWEDLESPKIIVGNLQSCGTGLNLQCSPLMIFFEGSTRGGDRIQAEDRAHRLGMCSQLKIVDLACLRIDYLVLENQNGKKAIHQYTLNELQEYMQHGEDERKAERESRKKSKESPG